MLLSGLFNVLLNMTSFLLIPLHLRPGYARYIFDDLLGEQTDTDGTTEHLLVSGQNPPCVILI